jgi:Domain of unknown function (DUF5060)
MKIHVVEITLTGPDLGNPFTEVQLSARFVLGRKWVVVDGFYDGIGTYKVRFMPDTEGEWTYTTSSNAPQLDGKAGRSRNCRSHGGKRTCATKFQHLAAIHRTHAGNLPVI